MNKFCRILFNLIIVILAFMMLTSCAKGNVESTNKDAKKKDIKIVTTIFPIYDFVKNVVKDQKNVKVKMLIKSGVDMHSFNPSAADLKDIADCDLFIYIGGESDKWVKSAIDSGINENMKALNLMESLHDLLLEEDADTSGGEDGEEIEYDEHIWLSPQNANRIVSEIAKTINDLAPNDNFKEKITSNASAYLEQIDSLNKEYKKAYNIDTGVVMVFADRFPFKYLCEDYNILYFAAFNGCSAESEASFEKVTLLSKAMDEYKLKYIFTLEGNNQKLAKTVIENTKDKNATILSLDSMQSITEKDVKNGASYIDIMKKNLEVLKKSLE